MTPVRPTKSRLTDRGIRALRPDPKRTIDYADTEVPGLRVRVTPAGVKCFGLRYDRGGKTRRRNYGRCFVEISLERARELARVDRQLLRDGIDPSNPPVVAAVPTFAEVVERWKAARLAKGHRQVTNDYRLLKRYAMPDAKTWPDLADREDLSLAVKPITTIDRTHVKRILHWMLDLVRAKAGLADGEPLPVGVGAVINKVRKNISGVFTYALDAGYVKGHPLIKMKLLVNERERKRALSMDELVKVWLASEQLGPEAAGCVKMLILTAQWRSEVSGLRRSEIVDGGATWILPAARRKQDNKHSKDDHAIPLSTAARDVIEDMPKWPDDHVFGIAGRRPYNGWRSAAKRLKELAALDERWTIHDLRRSVATLWGDELNAPWEITQRALGHSLKSKLGETARYDRSPRWAEVRRLYEDWGEFFITKVAAASSANVVHLIAEDAKQAAA